MISWRGCSIMSVRGEAGIAEVTATGLLALAPLAQRRTGRESLAERPGVMPIRRRGQGHAIREIRPFSEGDDPRHIDAAATARTGQLQVRSFHEDRERTLLLIADFRRPMLWGTRGCMRSVTAAEVLALEGWREATDGGSTGVVAITDTGLFVERPAHGARGMARIAGCLARAHDAARRESRAGTPTRPLAPELQRAARFAPRGAGLLVATGLDLPGPGWEETLVHISARGPVRFLLVEDMFETAPPAHALPVADPSGHGLRRRFSALPAAVAARGEALLRPGVSFERITSGDGR